MSAIPPEYISSQEACQRADRQWNDGIDKLQGRLLYGDLVAYVAGSDGDPRQLDTAFWAKAESKDVLVRGQIIEIKSGRHVSSRVVMKAEDVEQILPSRTVRVKFEGRQPQSTKNLGGRPPKYDWDRIWVEACILIYEVNLPKTPAEFRRMLEERLQEKKLPVPEESILKEKIRLLYKHANP